MIKFKGFGQKDFNLLFSKDKNFLKIIGNKFKNLLAIISGQIDGYSEIYKYSRGSFAGYLSKSRNRKNNAFFNLQLNTEDLSLEFQIENKDLLLTFLENVNIKTLNNLKKLGDCEIVVWDSNKKVCKIYPGSLDKSDIKFLMNKTKLTKYPIFKLRKIYSRNEAKSILESQKLVVDLLKSIRTMGILYKFT